MESYAEQTEHTEKRAARDATVGLAGLNGFLRIHLNFCDQLIGRCGDQLRYAWNL